MNLGGFVIHRGDGAMLRRCLDSLNAVCDDVVAVDCEAKRVSGGEPYGTGVRMVLHPWEGYGSARAAAVRELSRSDYVFFLDSDEWLEPDSIRAIRAWKLSRPRAPYYALKRRDHAHLGERRFVYRTEHHVRLVRTDWAGWERPMIVHEALPAAKTVRLEGTIEHLFATSVDAMAQKCEGYALLWALRFRDSRRRVKSPFIQHAFHLARELVLRGSLLRGGMDAIPLANAVARHHARKYELLELVRAGAYGQLVDSFARGDYSAIFAELSANCGPGSDRDPASAPDVAAQRLELRAEPGVPVE